MCNLGLFGVVFGGLGSRSGDVVVATTGTLLVVLEFLVVLAFLLLFVVCLVALFILMIVL